MYLSRRDGRIVDCNDAFARVLGYDTRADVVGKNARDFYADPTDRDKLLATLRPGRVLNNLEFEWRRRDGSTVPVLVNVTEIADGTDTIVEAIVLDLTATKWLEEAQRETEALRSVALLATAAAHEINNPLAVITGHLELLRMRFRGDDAVTTGIEQAVEAARRIAEIIAHMNHITHLQLSDKWKDVSPMLDLRSSGDRPPPSADPD